MMGRILVTGASGFVGGALVKRLQDAGRSVVALGRRPLPIKGYRTHDLIKPLPESFDGQYDAIVHAAARSSPWGRRQEFERDNVLATKNVVDFCQRNGSPRLVYVSSSSVFYRPQDQFQLTEESHLPTRAVNTYAETKKRGEEIVRQYNGPWAVLRPRAVYGPGDTVLLPRIIAAAKEGKLPILAPAGKPVIGDLIYIENLVDCLEQAANDPQIAGDYNLTDSRPVPIWDFLTDIFQRIDVPKPTRRLSVQTAMLGATVLEATHRLLLPNREPAITRFGVHVFAYSKTFCVDKMLTAFGSPQVSHEESVEHTVRWMQEPNRGVCR